MAVLDSDAEGTSPGCGNVRFLNSWKKLLKAAGNFTDSGGVLVVGNNRNALVEATIKHAHALLYHIVVAVTELSLLGLFP